VIATSHLPSSSCRSAIYSRSVNVDLRHDRFDIFCNVQKARLAHNKPYKSSLTTTATMASDSKVSVAELDKHAKPDDCWVVVNGKVYDLTTFAPNHPGGPDSIAPYHQHQVANPANVSQSVIYEWAGKDGSKTYNEYHSANLIEKSLSPSDKKGDFDTSTVTDTWLEAQKVASLVYHKPRRLRESVCQVRQSES
jgi:hypothetical protein